MSKDNLRQELIQVAAVAVSWVEDLTFGCADVGEATEGVLDEVFIERRRQDMKWGSGRHLDPYTWLAILAEEVGELAAEVPDPVGETLHFKAAVVLGKMRSYLLNAEYEARLFLIEGHNWAD